MGARVAMKIKGKGKRQKGQRAAKYFCLLPFLFSLWYGCALAQPYPSRPVRLVVPAAPGGAIDVVGRIVGQKLSEVLGQNVVIDNRAGANNIIGSSPAAFGKFLKEDLEKYARIARAAKIEPQ